MTIEFYRICGNCYCLASIKIKGEKKAFYLANAIDRTDAFEKIWQLIIDFKFQYEL